MTTRTEREKNKRQHDKHLSILMELLREDQNKYCADCRAKGPRWASWNLGIFVCITCAGIHRNLGVHISKVKSVNLDAWTQEQIKSMQEWGNKRAAQYYEYHLPSDFRRPHGDSSLEQFIRSKYEKKLYMRKEGPPPPCEIKQEKSKEKSKKSDSNKKIQQVSRPEVPKPVKTNTTIKETKPAVKTESLATGDLLSLSQPTVSQNNTLLSLSKTKEPETTADLLNFGSSSSFPPITNNSAPPPAQPPVSSPQGFAFDLAQTMSTPTNVAPNSALVPSSGQTSLEEDLFKDDITGGNQATKDSIMALYQPTQQQSSRQVFGVPGGVYLQQQQQQQQQAQPNVGVLNQANTMAPQYNTQFNTQQQQQQQQMYQLNQVQQQMAKLGYTQPPPMTTNQAMQNGQVMPNNRAVPNSQVMPGYNYNQTVPGMIPYHNGPAPYTTTPVGSGSGNWMPLKTGTTFPQPQQQQQQQQQQLYLTTGPAVQGFTMYQAQGGVSSGQTLSTNLWK